MGQVSPSPSPVSAGGAVFVVLGVQLSMAPSNPGLGCLISVATLRLGRDWAVIRTRPQRDAGLGRDGIGAAMNGKQI